MKDIYGHLSLKYICRLFGKSRQGWYNLQQHEGQKVLKNALILEKVRKIRTDLPKLGTLKLRIMLEKHLQEHHLSIGRDAFFELMRDNGMLIKNRRSYTITTNSNHLFKKFPDLVNQTEALMAEEIWVSDITYIRMRSGFAYLSLVTDAYSRKIVGYNLSHNLKANGCIKALQMAINSRIYPQRPLIHHSDRGIQYCCHAYVELLKKNRLHISMTQNGSPYDNAIAERINGILKTEFGLRKTFESFATVQLNVDQAIDKYNYLRPHFSCGLKTPQNRHLSAHVKPIQENLLRRKVISGKSYSKVK
jgi:transposase InsO family protein